MLKCYTLQNHYDNIWKKVHLKQEDTRHFLFMNPTPNPRQQTLFLALSLPPSLPLSHTRSHISFSSALPHSY